MKQSILTSVVVIGLLAAAAPSALAGGTVNFGNNASNRIVNGHSGLPIQSNAGVKAALYWAPLGSDSFAQLGDAVAVGTPAPGIFLGGKRTTDGATPAGESAKFQVRAWGGSQATFELASLEAGVLIGMSAVFTNSTGNTAGSPPTPPPSLLEGGLSGFVLTSNQLSQPPSIICVSNKSVACGSSWDFDLPLATDGCNGSNAVPVIILTTTNGSCPWNITRVWAVTNSCSADFALCSQTVSVIDAIPPVMSCASNKTVECGQPWSFDPPTVMDDCSSSVGNELYTITNAGCGNTFTATRTWWAADTCGNTNVCSQTVTVVDTTPPVLTSASNKLAACGAAWVFDEPLADDACGGTSLTVTVDSTVTNHPCPLIVTRTWSVVDSCGNSNTCSQTVTVTAGGPPLLACAANKVVHCTNAWSFDPPEALDECGGTNVSVEVMGTVTNSLCPLSLTRTWRATNACNSAGIFCSQTITVMCPDCEALQLTKSCPAYPVPPGGTLVWNGAITNASGITLSNVIVLNNQPATNTPVFGPMTLAPGEGASFTGSYSVPASSGPHSDTLSATGFDSVGNLFTGSVTTSCAGTNHVTPGDMNGDGIVDQAELDAVLAHYWPHSPWLSMTNAALLCDGRFQFELTNAGAWNFTVLVSTNATDWTNLPSPAFPVYQFVDPEGTNAPQRLYRLRWP